jgi:hypothetical protein
MPDATGFGRFLVDQHCADLSSVAPADLNQARCGKTEILRSAERAERLAAFYRLIGYFVTRWRVGVASVGAAGEIANVSHVFQPAGRLSWSNSPYALRFRYPCMLPTGKI